MTIEPENVWVKNGLERPIWEVPVVDLELALRENDRQPRTKWVKQARKEILTELHRRAKIAENYRLNSQR